MNRSHRLSWGVLGQPTRCAAVLAGMVLLAACERPPVESQQVGYRGTGMVDIVNPRTEAMIVAANDVPASVPPIPDTGGPRASDTYSNIQIPALQELGVAQFNRLMTALTQWVAPEVGCNYCHVAADLSSDDIYTKVVSRRMIEMTIDINTNWSEHVGATGVTCFTCHRGESVPSETWHTGVADPHAGGFAALSYGQNAPAGAVGLTSLPSDPLTAHLRDASESIRVQPVRALPTGSGASIQATEQTYALMIHMSESLGVNCTYCHNTRAFQPWPGSTEARVTAWHGLALARHVNGDYIEPLTDVFPPERLGPLGDAPKASCATCHRGQSRPLNGVSMTAGFPELTGD
jgi:photosynthetic reaction center cytochrome c subunit